MKVGIYTNTQKDKSLSSTRAVVSALDKACISYMLDSGLKGLSDNTMHINELIDSSDYIIVIGGDGTILSIVKECAFKNVPILGINAGTIGFLTKAELSEIPLLIECLKNKNFTIDRRSLLEAEYKEQKFFALNEVVLSRSGELITFAVSIGSSVIEHYAADGYLISSPTGSTAYSLSCGGPILSPHVNALVLTPINAHSLNSRSIVISDEEKTQLKILGDRARGNLILDGRLCANVFCDEEIIVRKSSLSASFINIREQNFYSRLFEKLKIWSSFK